MTIVNIDKLWASICSLKIRFKHDDGWIQIQHNEEENGQLNKMIFKKPV